MLKIRAMRHMKKRIYIYIFYSIQPLYLSCCNGLLMAVKSESLDCDILLMFREVIDAFQTLCPG